MASKRIILTCPKEIEDILLELMTQDYKNSLGYSTYINNMISEEKKRREEEKAKLNELTYEK